MTPEAALQLKIWGWAVTGDAHAIGPRQALRDCHVAALGERRDAEDGWWDLNLATLWTYELTRSDGTVEAPPWRMAICGASYA